MNDVLHRLSRFFKRYGIYYVFIILFVVLHLLLLHAIDLYMDREISKSRKTVETTIDRVFTYYDRIESSLGVPNEKAYLKILIKKCKIDVNNRISSYEKDSLDFKQDFRMNDSTSWYAIVFEKKQRDYIEEAKIIPFELRINDLKDSTRLKTFILHKLMKDYHVDGSYNKYVKTSIECSGCLAPYHKIEKDSIKDIYYTETNCIWDEDLSVYLSYIKQPLIAYYISENEFLIDYKYIQLSFFGTIIEIIFLVSLLFLLKKKGANLKE